MRKSRGATLKLVAVSVVAISAVAVVVALGPLGLLNSGGGTVRFYSQAYFLLIGTEDNGFLGTDNLSALALGEEGVALSLPDPNVDNKAFQTRGDYVESSVTSLWHYKDNEFTLEIKQGTDENFRLVGDRTSLLVIGDIGCGYLPETAAGPKYGLLFDKIYPNEIIMFEQWWGIPANLADNLTLRDTASEADPYFGPTNVRISAVPIENMGGYFFAGLYKIDGENRIIQIVEQFEGTTLSSSNGWVPLYPT